MALDLLNPTSLLTAALAGSLADLVQRVQRSLVVVHHGKRGAGAGVIWQAGGYIITNQHVVAAMGPAHWPVAWGRRSARPSSLSVSLVGGMDFPARLVAQDPEIDLALLQVEGAASFNERWPAALVADSRSLRVGQMILAVGHPWGQRGVVTAGIISGLSNAQSRGPRGTVPIIRSDVVLAPGNSGGPMVNAVGAVVGINTMIVGGDLGVAIPSHLVSEFVRQALGQPGPVDGPQNGQPEALL